MVWLCFVHAVWGQGLPIGETSEEIGLGCVVRIQGTSPSVRIEGEEYFFHDDAVPPDKIAGDGVFSLFIPTLQEKNIDVQLWTDGALRWSGLVPLPPKGQQTWLSIDEKEKGVRPIVNVSFLGLSHQSMIAHNSTNYDAGYMIWIALVVGIVLGFRLHIVPHVSISRWLPHAQEKRIHTHLISFLPSDDVCDVLQKRLQEQQILLCTSRQRRGLFTSLANSVPVYLGQKESYEVASLRSEIAILQKIGPSVVLLDGMHGLLKPNSAEEPLAVLTEILNDSSLVVVLVFVGEEIPQGISIPSVRYSESTENKD